MRAFIVKATIRCGVLAAALVVGSCLADGDIQATDLNKTIYGKFQVNLVEQTSFSDAYTSVLGRVSDGPTPSTLEWHEAAASGECRLLIPRAPFCDPGCGSSAACVADGVCQAYPKGLNVGTVTLKGVKDTLGKAMTISMEPLLANYQPSAGVRAGYPPFTEGNEVTLTATGDTAGKFTLKAKAIVPLQLLYDSVIFASGQPVTLRWTPPATPANSAVSARFDISHHGGVKGVIECEGADDGEMTVAATLVDSLKGLGISGFPTVELARHAESSVPDFNVTLWLESRTSRPISIPGIVSCIEDGDCPSGQTCQQDAKCQ